MTQPSDVTAERHDDEVRWLAMLLREGCLLIAKGIGKRYGLDPVSSADRERLYFEWRQEARRVVPFRDYHP